MMTLNKRDGAGNTLKPGDVCIRHVKGKLEYIVYKKEVWGGNGSKGEFGRFVTAEGESSIKFSNVLFAFDPLSSRRAKATKVIRKYYEEK